MIKLLFILIIIYFVSIIFFRYIIPLFFRAFVRKMQRNVFDQNKQYSKSNNKSKNSRGVHIDYVPKKPRISVDKVGEYIDFEEVK